MADLAEQLKAVGPVSLDRAVFDGATFGRDEVTELRIVLRDGRTQRLQLPAPVPAVPESAEVVAEKYADEELAEQILDVLRTLKPGEYMLGEAICKQVQMEGVQTNSGTWTRAIEILTGNSRQGVAGNPPKKLIESRPRHGYRLVTTT